MTTSTPQTWLDYGLWLAAMVGWSLFTLVVLLVIIAFLLLMDRKVWAAVQLRRGPNVVGPFGLFQSFADLLKFVFKEPIIPAGANKGVFLLAPIATATFALAAWAVIPVNQSTLGRWVISDLNVGVLYLLALSSLAVYGIIMGGWASNSKYPFMGSLRSAAQMVSYEVSIGFVIITVILCAGSLNLTDIVNAQTTGLGTERGLPNSVLDWYWLPLLPMFVIFFVSALAETNRPPFDLVEAESELVAGFMVEYSADAVSAVHARRVRGDRHHVRADDDPVSGRLAAAGCDCAADLGAGRFLVRSKMRGCLLHVRHGEGDRAALPLRPAHAAWMEGVSAPVIGDGRDRRRVAAVWAPRDAAGAPMSAGTPMMAEEART